MNNEQLNELKELSNKRKTKNSMLKQYELTKANEYYIIYFVYNHKLYRTITKELNKNFIKKGKSSSHKNILRMSLNNAHKKNFIEYNVTTEFVMTENELNELNEVKYNNKGRTIEYIEYKRNNQQDSYILDNVRYDKDGDITINGVKYQIKFENATITTYDTITKVTSEKLA